MRNDIYRIVISTLLIVWMVSFHSVEMSQAMVFSHEETFGKWTKKVASDGYKEPLYVTFTQEFGQPDSKGVVVDRISITVMEPPEDHDSYDEFVRFMSPDSIKQPENMRIIANPVTTSTLYIGGFQAKVISGTGMLRMLEPSGIDIQLLGKGYYLTLPDHTIEILAQVQTIRGDMSKIEAEVDAFVSSFRFGEPEDSFIVRAIKRIPFQLESVAQPIKTPAKMKLSLPILLAVIIVLILTSSMILVLINKQKKKPKQKKLGKKRKKQSKP